MNRKEFFENVITYNSLAEVPDGGCEARTDGTAMEDMKLRHALGMGLFDHPPGFKIRGVVYRPSRELQVETWMSEEIKI